MVAKGNGPPLTCASTHSTPSTSNPIAIGTGNKWLSEIDIEGNGVLRFTRYYNSNVATVSSAFGARWRSAYGQRLNLETATGTVRALRPDGKIFGFLLSGNNYVVDADISDRLYRETNAGGTLTGYRLETTDYTTERYDTAGRLASIANSTGQIQTLTYDALSRLSTVSDAFGRQLTFTYDAQNRIATLVTPANGTFAYTYDTANNLATVTYPDATTRTYHYNEPQYTGGANLPNALTGITDENGVRYASYTYDSTGKAVEEIAPAVGTNTNRYQLVYSTNSTAVTDPLNTLRTYSFQTVLGIQKSTGSSQPGGSGCGPASSAITYDANGNVASRTDFNGNLTTYTYDLARNLETTRTEGLTAAGVVTPQTRAMATEWHPTIRLVRRMVEPLRLTTYIYNGDSGASCGFKADGTTLVPGVLCSKSVQATTDVRHCKEIRVSIL